MKEREIKKSTFLPVFLGVWKDKMQSWHEENVGSDEEEEREVIAGPEAVREQHQDEQTTNYLE